MKKLFLFLFIVLSLSGFAQRTEVDTMTNRINYTVNPLNGLNVRGIFRIRTIDDADTITSAKIQTWDNSAIQSAAATEQLADTLDADDNFVHKITFAGDTSNYPVPDNIGDMFIDTNAGKIYVSKTKARNGWIILNSIILIGSIRLIRRKK